MSSRATRQSDPELLNNLLADGQLVNHLFRKAGLKFQNLITLSGSCPKCRAYLVIEYASDPGHYSGKMLSMVIACAAACDKWDLATVDDSTAVKAGQTHWWLDEDDNSGGLAAVIQSLPRGEAELAGLLHAETVRLNSAWLRTVGAAS